MMGRTIIILPYFFFSFRIHNFLFKLLFLKINFSAVTVSPGFSVFFRRMKVARYQLQIPVIGTLSKQTIQNLET